MSYPSNGASKLCSIFGVIIVLCVASSYYSEWRVSDISAEKCLDDWLSGVSSTGTFTKAPTMESLPSGASGIPTGWTVVDYEE